MAVKEKEMNTKLYAVVVFAVVAVILTVATVFTFTSKYSAFHTDKLAQAYVDSIVQKGDGYNAYKYTLVSKSEKYGDFIRQNYIYPVIYEEAGYQPGDSTKNLKGLNDSSYQGDNTKEDDGTLEGQVIDAMYPYFEELMQTYGWDDYDSVFTLYIQKFVETRANVFGDNYLSDSDIFTSLEANVSTYGDSLTGTEETYDENTDVKLTDKTIGVYQTKYGEDYAFTVETTNTQEVDVDSYVSALDTDILAIYGVEADDISAVSLCTVDVSLEDGTVVASQDLYLVKIGNSWYVDNTTIDTSVLYNFYK